MLNAGGREPGAGVEGGQWLLSQRLEWHVPADALHRGSPWYRP